MNNNQTARALAIVQGAYFAATGVWPLVDMRSFDKVTGPRVSKIYLADAAAEAALIAAWTGCRRDVSTQQGKAR